MKGMILSFLLLTVHAFSWGANVRIIESQSFNSGHQMDIVWQSVATGMGHTVTISPQTTLDNNAFFGSTDVLIVSSGVIALSAGRETIIRQFVQSGKPVYIQSEYLCNYTSNLAFSNTVNLLGGTITWGNTTAGTLVPMVVNGAMGNNPNVTGSLTYYWYGCYGTPSNLVQSFLTFGGLQYGFMFCPPSPAIGRMATTTDQDWVRASTNLNLMRNILSHLLTPISCAPPLAEINLDLKAFPQTNGAVHLQWSTDLVNDGTMPPLFVLERSLDQGVTFDPIFQTINNEVLTYLDQPMVVGQSIRYRLRVVDSEGMEFYSLETSILIPEINGLLNIAFQNNPIISGTESKLAILAGSSMMAKAEIYDLRGLKIGLEMNLELDAGLQNIVIPTHLLRPGTYFLSLKTETANPKLKFVVI